MSKVIPLSRGKFSIVDDWNYERLLAMGPWHCDDHGTVLYAVRWGLNPVTGKMGSVTMPNCVKGTPPDGKTWDHIDGNGLNNQEGNLRLATMAQQVANRPLKRTNTSGFKGIYFQKTSEAWIAQIKVRGKSRHLGLFKEKEAAAMKYDCAALENFGEFVRLNFDKSYYLRLPDGQWIPKILSGIGESLTPETETLQDGKVEHCSSSEHGVTAQKVEGTKESAL